ncbi:MAG: peptidase [Bacteroidetes bacterium]|nr:peptidase [Bacteroidota bacterium]
MSERAQRRGERTNLKRNRDILFIFLDGVGIGVKDPSRNPFFDVRPPFLTDLLGGTLPSLRNRTIQSRDALCIPLDPNLGIPGLPQSGTGQATLYTGINTAQLIGRHFGPYLYSTLKPVVAAHNIFARLQNKGRPSTVALANAFPQRFFDYLQGPQRRMVAGMYAAIVSGVRFRDISDLRSGLALSTDITAARWSEIGHHDAPLSTPYEGGRTLARIAGMHAFTLYEYFLTDKAGHARDRTMARNVLSHVDDLLRGIHDHIDHNRTLVIVTSDHGNIEEINIKPHTRHPVPLILFGNRRGFETQGLLSLSHLAPAICNFLT